MFSLTLAWCRVFPNGVEVIFAPIKSRTERIHVEFWEVTSVRYIGVLVELRFCCLRPTWGIRACFLRCLCEVAGWARGVYAVFFCMIGYSYYPKGHILVLCVSWDMYSEWSA